MKPTRMFATALLGLALLLHSAPMPGPAPTQAAGSFNDFTQTVEPPIPLNDTELPFPGNSIPSVPSEIQSSAGTWHTKAVNSEGDVGAYTSLALDRAG